MLRTSHWIKTNANVQGQKSPRMDRSQWQRDKLRRQLPYHHPPDDARKYPSNAFSNVALKFRLKSQVRSDELGCWRAERLCFYVRLAAARREADVCSVFKCHAGNTTRCARVLLFHAKRQYRCSVSRGEREDWRAHIHLFMHSQIMSGLGWNKSSVVVMVRCNSVWIPERGRRTKKTWIANTAEIRFNKKCENNVYETTKIPIVFNPHSWWLK